MTNRPRNIPTDDDLMRIAMYQEQKDQERARVRVSRVLELERRYAPLVAGLAKLTQQKMSNNRSMT